jgi:hypothetical protein
MEIEQPSLSNNQFYLIISQPNYYFKSKIFKEFNEIKTWKNCLFSGIVSSNQFIHFLVGLTWHKKKIQFLKTAIPFEKNYFYDIENLEISGESIKKIKIGGNQKVMEYEKL